MVHISKSIETISTKLVEHISLYPSKIQYENVNTKVTTKNSVEHYQKFVNSLNKHDGSIYFTVKMIRKEFMWTDIKIDNLHGILLGEIPYLSNYTISTKYLNININININILTISSDLLKMVKTGLQKRPINKIVNSIWFFSFRIYKSSNNE